MRKDTRMVLEAIEVGAIPTSLTMKTLIILLTLCSFSLANELDSSVRVGTNSGTIIYSKEYTYILTCGHMFADVEHDRGVDYYIKHPKTTLVEIFDGEIKKINGDVLCTIDQGVRDVGLVRFKGDGYPTTKICDEWFNLKPPKINEDIFLVNIGCDFYTEPKEYKVRYLFRERRLDTYRLVCIDNPAFGGRSGGGLFYDGKLFGTTMSSDRKKYTYYTCPQTIHEFLRNNKLHYLVE